MRVHINIFYKILAMWVQQHIKKIIYYDYVGFIIGMQVYLNIWKINKQNTTCVENQEQNKKHNYCNIWRKGLWQNSIPFHEALKKLGIEEIYLSIIKPIHDKPTVNIILNGEKLKPFPLK
jgi:hypothetical protein